MRKVLTLVITAAMGLSSIASAAETAATPAPTATTIKATPTEATHHKKQHKAIPIQKTQAARKYHKNTKAEQKAPEQKTQTTKKHAERHSYQQPTKPAAQPVAQVFNSNAGAPPHV